MSGLTRRPTRMFTVEEANRMLPLVRAIVSDITSLSREVIERRQRLSELTAGRELDKRDLYAGELAEVNKDLEQDTRRLQEYIQELRQLGVEPKGPEGLVDFPTLMDGRIVYLCWKLGEPEVLFWHEVDDGFAGRQPLTADSVSGSGLEADDSLR